MPNGGIDRENVVDAAIKQFASDNKLKRLEGITEIEIGAFLVQRRAPDGDGLSGDGLPAKLVHRGMEAHADGRAENRSEPANEKAKAVALADGLQVLLGLQFGLGIRTLRFQVGDRTVFVYNLLLRSIHAGCGEKDKCSAGGSA